MPLPIRPSDLEYVQKFPKYIVLHDTNELNLNVGSLVYDDETFQTHKLQKSWYELTKEPNLPYHFVIEKFKDDYFVISTRPILTAIPFGDIDEDYQKNSIHIAMVGDYSSDIASSRIYSILGFKILAPMLRLFSISDMNIITHSEISKDEHKTCPGDLFNVVKLRGIIRNYIKKNTVTRT